MLPRNMRKLGGFVQCLAIAAYSLNAMKGRVGAGRTRPATRPNSYSHPAQGKPRDPILLRAALVAILSIQ